MAQLDKLTRKYASNLRRQFGVGPQRAATLLAVADDNPDRLKNKAALASICGVIRYQHHQEKLSGTD